MPLEDEMDGLRSPHSSQEELFERYIVKRYLLDDRKGEMGKILDAKSLRFKDSKLEGKYVDLYHQAITTINHRLVLAALVFGSLLLLHSIFIKVVVKDARYWASEGFRMAGLSFFLIWAFWGNRVSPHRQPYVVSMAYIATFISSCLYKVPVVLIK